MRAVAFEEDGVWVVQGIEYDICTHAKEAAEVPQAFYRAVIENICITQHLGRRPLEGIKPAPKRFREMFERAESRLMPVHELGSPELPRADMDIRLAEHA
ncbi:MAG: hypothetical protein JO124_18295 [Hyphomicrobiales bacterium]|nr:hypothetical protein [Hyphomicrobiales bacterium]